MKLFRVLTGLPILVVVLFAREMRTSRELVRRKFINVDGGGRQQKKPKTTAQSGGAA